jgi:hypothetical protein
MGIRLEDGVGTTYGPNAHRAEPDDRAPIVNLHPSFVFGREEVNDPLAFPSLNLGARMVTAALAERARRGLPEDEEVPSALILPPITAECDALRAAWSLTRNGRSDLARRRIDQFQQQHPVPDPLDGLEDWLFRFAERLTLPAFGATFEGIFEQLEAASTKEDFPRFLAHYGEHMSVPHSRRYFEVCKAYLGTYTEFSQVHDLVTSGIDVEDGMVAASTNFDATRMIYGNAFEAFGDNVEVLVALNNLVEGRPFDRLRTITLEEYLQTDKAGRVRAIADNPAFAAGSTEFDSQLRNASHHGGMSLDRAEQRIEYRTGRGGQGELRSIGYARYLAACTRLFVQLMLLFRLEILITHRFSGRAPV